MQPPYSLPMKIKLLFISSDHRKTLLDPLNPELNLSCVLYGSDSFDD